MEYRHNNMSKDYMNSNTNNYIVKVNSRDRDIKAEPNPFNFKIKFNKIQGKTTICFKPSPYNVTNYFDSCEQIEIHNGAVIEDPIEEVKDINISEIVAPRFIPEDYVGLKIDKVQAVTNPNDKCGIFLKTTDNARVTFFDEIVEDSNSNEYFFKFFRIEDIYGKKYYLFNSTDTSNLKQSNNEPYTTIKKNYYLNNDYFTDTLLLNNSIYKIGDVSDGYLKLSINDSSGTPDFINSELILPDYYTDIIWHYNSDSTTNATIDYDQNSIDISDNAESLFAYDLVKDSIIELYDFTDQSYNYMKIESVVHTVDLSGQKLIKTYPNITFDQDEYNLLKKFITDTSDNIKNTVKITGKWIYNKNFNISKTGTKIRLRHLKSGVKDLLNEKLFYLSLEPITPPKNLITNNRLNHVIGTFYPSTQSKNYIFLSGQNRQTFTHRNLKNLNELKFKLYYIDGKVVGESLQNYSLDYLTMECKQSNLTLLIDCVDRHFS